METFFCLNRHSAPTTGPCLFCEEYVFFPKDKYNNLPAKPGWIIHRMYPIFSKMWRVEIAISKFRAVKSHIDVPLDVDTNKELREWLKSNV